MRLILLGPPGSGKGTQAKLLCKRQRLDHIGTGDLIRSAIREHTPLGLQAETFVNAGGLVPDNLVIDLVADHFDRPGKHDSFVMDGFPRTKAQGVAFDRILTGHRLDVTAVLLLRVADEEIILRVTKRWSCPKPGCKATYHTEIHPPKVTGVCDDCGTKLVQRDDDKPETVTQRLVVYHRDTAELIPYYRQRGLLREVDGHGEIETIYNNMIKVLSQ